MQALVVSVFLFLSVLGLTCSQSLRGLTRWSRLPSSQLSSSELGPGDSSHLDLLETTTVKRQASDTGDQCRDFAFFPGSLTLRGSIFRLLGHGYTAEECKQACADTTEFTCVAALIRNPAFCYISGYRLRNDYFSTHFARTCSEGPSCFRAIKGSSAGFTDFELIPNVIPVKLHAWYCMVQCQRRQMCVGVDLKTNRPRCVFMDLEEYPDSNFNLYVRRC